MSTSNERRPAANHEAAKSIGPDSPSIAGCNTNSQYPVETTQRRYWARRLLDAGTGWAIYGSAEWNAYAEDDPRRMSACVAAAEAYTERYDDLEANLHRELADERLAFKHADDDEYQARVAQHRAQWGGRFQRTVKPTFEERRQEQIAAAERMAERAGSSPRPSGGAS